MAYVIAEPCIGVKDGACLAVCPIDCIFPRPESPEFESAEQLFIDPSACIDCGMCADECPVKAIFAEEDLPAEWQSFIAKNRDYFQPKPG